MVTSIDTLMRFVSSNHANYIRLEYLASGMTHEELLAEFPDLTETDIQACLSFAANRERKLAAAPA